MNSAKSSKTLGKIRLFSNLAAVVLSKQEQYGTRIVSHKHPLYIPSDPRRNFSKEWFKDYSFIDDRLKNVYH